MREMIYSRVSSHIEPGRIQPAWLVAVRAILFPLQFLQWKLGGMIGYDFRSDIWRIHGTQFYGGALFDLSRSEGGVFKVTRNGDVLVFERLRND